MLCYGMLRHVMLLGCVTLCYVMLCTHSKTFYVGISTTRNVHCSHSILLYIEPKDSVTRLSDPHRRALSWISVIGCALSLAGTITTVAVTFYFWKNVHSPRSVVLVNLCVAIAITNVVIIAEETVHHDNKVKKEYERK